MEKLLPQNIEAEQGVLGSIILDPDAIVQVADFLVARDFYRDAHREIYKAILDLYEEHAPADFITICDELERRNQLEAVGGASYITSLVDNIPTSSNVEWYGRIVERKAIQRKLIHAAGQIAAIAYGEEVDAQAALDKAEQIIFDIGRSHIQEGLTDLSEIMRQCMDDLDYAHEHRHSPIGVPTGYTDMDGMLGRLQPSDLILLAGRPGQGKSSLGMNIAYHAAKAGIRVAVFSLEMGKKQLGQRLISMLTGIPTQRLRNGWIEDHEWDKIVVAQEHLSELPISIDDATDSPVVTIKSKVRRKEQETREKVGLIVVDYMGLMEMPENEHQYENRVQEITKISRGLKKLAKEFNVPVLAMAQLSRKVEDRAVKIPQLSDLRDSGSLEQDADVVLFVYRDDQYAGVDQEGKSKSNRPGTADIIVAKHRNGDTGSFLLRFVGKRTSFYNMDETVED